MWCSRKRSADTSTLCTQQRALQLAQVGGHVALAGRRRRLQRREPGRVARHYPPSRQLPHARQLPEHGGAVQRRLTVLQLCIY